MSPPGVLGGVPPPRFWGTWKTVSRAWGKVSKVLRLVWVSSKLKRPPKSCMPRRAKMMMKRKRRRRREAMDFMELSKEPTRLLSDAQCLRETPRKGARRLGWRGEGARRGGAPQNFVCCHRLTW